MMQDLNPELPSMPAWARISGVVLDRATSTICVLLLIGIVADVLAGAISRYVFNNSLSWTENAGRWMFSYMIFLGAALAQRRRSHVTVDFLRDHLPETARPVLQFIIDMIVVFTLFSLLFHSFDLMQRISGVDILLRVPNWMKFAAIPVGAILSLVFIVLRGFEKGEPLTATLGAVSAGGAVFWLSTVYPPSVLLHGISPSLLMSLTFLITLLMGVPVAFAMLFSAFLAIFGANLQPAPAVVQNVVNGAGSFLLLAIPLFILAGQLMNVGGLATRLIDLAASLVGNIRGGLAQVNVLSSLLFGGVSSSAGADAALNSKLIVPQMRRHGFSAEFSCAVTSASAILPNIVPPSSMMLVFASISGASVWQLFMAGYLPGLMMMTILMVIVYVTSLKRGYTSQGQPVTLVRMFHSLLGAMPVLSLAVLILGTIRFGIVTPTEAGALAVVYALFLGKFVYRGYTWRQLLPELRSVSVDAATIGFLVGVSGPFAFVLVAEQIPQTMIAWAVQFASSPETVLLLVAGIGLLLGLVLEPAVGILILTPLFLPLIRQMGIDDVQFAIVLIISVVLGGITPPVGMLVFIPSQITGTPASGIFREVTPFLSALIVGLLLLCLFPVISLGLVWLAS